MVIGKLFGIFFSKYNYDLFVYLSLNLITLDDL